MATPLVLPIPDGHLVITDKPALCECGRMHLVFVNVNGKTSCILRESGLGILKHNA